MFADAGEAAWGGSQPQSQAPRNDDATLFVGGLVSAAIDERDLREHFEVLGCRVVDVRYIPP